MTLKDSPYEIMICPQSENPLRLVSLGRECVLHVRGSELLYPIIDGVIVMCPVSRQVRRLCEKFFQDNGRPIAALGIDPDPRRLTACLLPEGKDGDRAWMEEEMSFWEEKFQEDLRHQGRDRLGWNRTIPRERIITDLKDRISAGVVLEIGCGGSHSLRHIFHSDLPRFYGLDLSYYACQLSRKAFPGGIFIQSPIVPLPFREESIDFIFAYGVFHHLPGHEENIRKVLPVLRQGGYLAGSDPLPGYSRGGSREKEAGPSTSTSPHNDWIDWPGMVVAAGPQVAVFRSRKEYGPLRGLLIRFFYDRLGIRGRLFSRLLIGLDTLWLNTAGRLSRRLGPRGILYVLHKRSETNSV